MILVAGGARTRRALAYAGVASEAMIDTLDSGVAPMMFDIPPVAAQGRCGRFVFVGRLVAYKGCDLAIEALAQTPRDVTLDIIGDGPERAALEALAAARGLSERVRFLGWQIPDDRYYRALQEYRALVLPTLAEANGIVFQEAMVLGLPIIAVKWGGAAQLLDSESAILIDPSSPKSVIRDTSTALVRLANDGTEADRLATNARRQAEAAGFAWPQLIATWEGVYDSVRAKIPA